MAKTNKHTQAHADSAPMWRKREREGLFQSIGFYVLVGFFCFVLFV